MKKFLLILSLVNIITSYVFSQTYTTGTTNWTNSWAQNAGAFNFTNGIGLFSFNTGTNDGAVEARLITTDGTTGGTATTLNPGQKLSITVAGQDASGRTGITSGGRIGFALRTNSSLFHDGGTANVFNRYDASSIVRVEFVGGNSNANFTNSAGSSFANMPNFATFKSGVTYDVEVISDKEFNLVIGGIRDNVQLFANGGGAIRQITTTSISSNMDGLFTNLVVSNLPVNVTANTGETYTVTGVISNNGGTSNTLQKNGVGTVILTGANTYTGLTTVNAGTLQLNKSGGTTLPITNNITVAAGTLKISTSQGLNNLTLASGATLNIEDGVTLTINGTFNQNGGTINLNSTGVIAYGVSGILSYGGSGAQTATASEFPATSGPNALTINNSAGVILPSSFSRTINGALTLSSGTLSIGSNTLTINGAVSGSGTFTGTASSGVSTSNLVLGGAAGTINFTQTDATTRSLNDLTLNNGASATLGNSLEVYGTITLANSSAVLNLNDKSLTLKSNATNTARIAALAADGSNLTGATSVIMERYIPARGGNPTSGGRAYRLLGPTVNTSGSIKANWQEGQMNNVVGTNANCKPGYGTHITGSGGNTNGFDVTQSNAASLYATTNGITPGYTAYTSTSGTLDAKTGYWLFIRGDRGVSTQIPQSDGMPTSSTTLRTTGNLLKGNQTFTGLSSTPLALSLITNPYPSAIDWAAVYGHNSATDFAPAYTLWDPNIGSRGGFVLVTNTNVVTPYDPLNTGSGATRFIQPGQAFFVQSLTTSGTSFTINETDKSTNNSNAVFRPGGGQPESFAISLYYNESTGYHRLADGATAIFDNSYSKSLDIYDAPEINNWDENIAIAREGKHLALESRPVIMASDILPLFMNNMKQRGYEFSFTPVNFTNTSLRAELIDNYLGTKTSLSVTDPVTVAFTINANPASSASDRFSVVFNAPPIDQLTTNAYQKNRGVQVEWTIKTETGMDHYEVERSADGVQFAVAGSQLAVGSSSIAVNYNWFDMAPQAGNNFYRVKAMDKFGQVKYSDVVKVTIGKGQPAVTVYPNPLSADNLGLQLRDLDKGIYTISLYNKLGQRVFNTELQHPGGTATIAVSLNNKLLKGIYQMVLTGENNVKLSSQVIKN